MIKTCSCLIDIQLCRRPTTHFFHPRLCNHLITWGLETCLYCVVWRYFFLLFVFLSFCINVLLAPLFPEGNMRKHWVMLCFPREDAFCIALLLIFKHCSGTRMTKSILLSVQAHSRDWDICRVKDTYLSVRNSSLFILSGFQNTSGNGSKLQRDMTSESRLINWRSSVVNQGEKWQGEDGGSCRILLGPRRGTLVLLLQPALQTVTCEVPSESYISNPTNLRCYECTLPSHLPSSFLCRHLQR